jgi:acetylornithine deacetylase
MDAKELTVELIAHNTVSYNSNVEVMKFLRKRMLEIDCQVEWVEYVDPSGVQKVNLIGKKGGNHDPGDRGIALLGHIDTVPAIGWESNAFEARIEGTKMYGRGSCDMKGSVACMLETASKFSNSDLDYPLYVVVTADEEVGFHGAQAVADKSELFQGLFPRYGVVGEPTLLGVIHAHKGIVQMAVTAHGRAAHSSTGEGDNANLKLIPFLVEMRDIYYTLTTDSKYFNDEFDPPFSDWNITIDNGDCAPNITSPFSICRINYRPMPGQNPQEWIHRVRQSADKHGLEFELRAAAEPMVTPRESEVVRAALEITGEANAHTVPYGTDGAVFGQHMELVVIGPGSILQAHTVDEWMEVDQFPKAVSVFSQFVERFCKSAHSE